MYDFLNQDSFLLVWNNFYKSSECLCGLNVKPLLTISEAVGRILVHDDGYMYGKIDLYCKNYNFTLYGEIKKKKVCNVSAIFEL